MLFVIGEQNGRELSLPEAMQKEKNNLIGDNRPAHGVQPGGLDPIQSGEQPC